MRTTLIVFLLAMGILDATRSQCDTHNCVDGFSFSCVASHLDSDGREINIFECSNERLIRFYLIELSGFRPGDGARLESIDTVTKGSFDLIADECGEVSLTIYPIQPKRSFVVLDFSFWLSDRKLDMQVSKYLARPEDKEKREERASKPTDRG